MKKLILCFVLLYCTFNHLGAQTSIPTANTIWLMGEVHDNPQGHQLRLLLLQQNLLNGWRPSLVLEQLDREQESTVNEALKKCANANCFIEQVNLKNWDWPLYKDLIELALQYQLPIHAGNLSRKEASAVMKQGFKASLPATLIDALQLDTAIPEIILTTQIKAIDEGHCGQMPANYLAPMAKAQIARDVWMAYRLQQALVQNPKGVVLIAGNGHTRKDIGVLQWLAKSQQATTRSFGFLEHPNSQDPTIYDEVITIKPIQRPDMCEQLKKK
jgi:uncharacterized iron-regulated protein